MSNELANVRDVGGLPVSGGGTLRSGVLLRSDAPRDGDLPPGLEVWPPRTVIDLRSREELADDHPLALQDTEVVALPLSGHASLSQMLATTEGPDGLTTLYRATVAAAAPLFAMIAELVATRPAPVLVHCTAGKDRTGMVVAVLLAAVGVEREEVVADYVRTAGNMPRVLDRVARSPVSGGMAVVQRIAAERPWLLDAPREAIEALLDAVDAEAGDAGSWLVRHGLREEHLARLRDVLVA